MATIDIRGLYNILVDNIKNGVLTLPMGAIPSAPIDAIFVEFMNKGPLVLGNADPKLNVAANLITIDGTSGQSFPLQGTTVDAVFTIINNVPQMELAGHLPSGAGSLTKPFPKLEKTLYATVAFSQDTLLSLSSWDAAPTRPRGLTLDGAVRLAGGLASIRVLFNSDQLAVNGPITITSDVPVFDITSSDEGTVAVGTFGLLFMRFNIADAAIDSGGEWSAEATMQVVSGIDYSAAGKPKQLAIYTPTPFESNEILFQGDLTEALELGLAAVSQLANSANVQGLLPTQLPIPALVEFRQWTMALDTATANIRTLTVNIRLNTGWEIVPNLLALELIDFNFMYSSLDATPLSMIAQAKIALGEEPEPGIIDVYAYYPGFRFDGRLDPRTKINLNTLILRFIGADAASILPNTLAINELSFSVDPANVNFSILVGVETEWDFSIGGVAFTFTGVRSSIQYVAQKVSGFISASFQVLPEPNQFTIEVTAGYKDPETGWYFISKLKDGTINLGALIAYYAPTLYVLEGLKITALEVRIQTGTNQSYGFTLAAQWDITSGSSTIVALGTYVQIDALTDGGVTTYKGLVSGTAEFWGVSMSATVDMTVTPTIYRFTFWEVSATLQGGVLVFRLPNRSLGEIITLLVNAAFPNAGITLPPPFNVLNAIRLSDFEFRFDFNTSKASIRYPASGNLGLDFGFLAINQFELTYDGDAKVVDLKVVSGRFLDQTVTPEKPKTFPVSDPTAMANQVPGQGDELLRLTFLGMGQHVSPLKPIPPGTTIATAVSQLEGDFKKTTPQRLLSAPQTAVSPISGTELKFDDGANWIIAGDFTFLNTVTLKALFLDPELYGVSIAVSGPKAANFEGLSFDILYRRVNDNVGVYQIELALPTAFRQMEFGQVSITLPIIKVEIFTNGDFRIDLGFPTNGDFSRSFGVQVLPFTGAGGIYFGVMSGATSTKVPQVQNCGQFSPVLELGVGLRIGIGKEIDKGILAAGLSVTLQGIVEGVIAWYSPYDTSITNKAFFYSIKGKFAIVGNLYGAINFAIISARLDITVTIGVTLSLQIYEPMQFGFFASVTVSLTVKINLGIFRISINLSFRATIQESFTIGKRQVPPWSCSLSAAERRAIAGARPLGASSLDEDACGGIEPELVWQPILLDGASRWTIEILTVAQLTAASPVDKDGNVGDATPRAVTSLYARTTPGDVEEDAPFFVLAKGIFLWGLNAWLFREQSGVTLAQLLAATVTAEDLQAAYCGMLEIAPGGVEPFTKEELDAFVTNFFLFDLKVAQQQSVDTNVSAVPIVPVITMKLPDGTPIDFATENETTTDELNAIKEYFRELEMRAEKAAGGGNLDSTLSLSMATFFWMDFYSMVAREAMQAAIDTLKNATLVSTGTESLQDLLATRPLLGRDVRDVARANLTRRLNAGVTLQLPPSRRGRANAGSVVTGGAMSTLLAVARRHDVDPIELAVINAAAPGLFAPGRILVPDAEALTVEQLLEMMSEQQQFQDLSGLAARVLLAGLRPPYRDPKDPKELTLQALYDISAQQFDATGITTEKSVTLTVPAADWIRTSGGTSMKMDFTDAEVAIAEQFANIQLLPSYLEAPHAEPLYRTQPKRFTLANPIEWNDGSTSTGVWGFPDDLQTLITGEHALRPKVRIEEQGQDAAHRAPYDISEILGAIPHTWTTTFSIVVRRIPSALDPNAPVKSAYDLRGTDQTGGLLLQRLLTWWSENGEPDIVSGIRILYPPDPAQPDPPPGLISDPADKTSIFVLQTNLSTASNPGDLAARAARTAALESGGIIGQTAIEFLRLIWECSIVRSGGYDFYYEANGAGLPDYLWEQGTDVTLTVVVQYAITDDVLESFLNSVVIDQPVDPESPTVYFIEPIPQTVPDAMIAADATLETLAKRHHATVAEIAMRNRDRLLRPNRPIVIPAGAHVVRGDEPHANGIPVPGGTLVLLPQRTLTTQQGDKLESLAAHHGTSVAALAVANRDARYLFTNTPDVEDQLIERIVQIPPGNVAWSAVRNAPAAPQLTLDMTTVPEEDAQNGLQQLYNLLAFMIVGTPQFNETDWSLPAGPQDDTTPTADPNEDRDALLAAQLEAGEWPYRAVLPVARFSTSILPQEPGAPPVADDPYRGVGTSVVLDLEYLDMFGNRVKTNGGQPTLLTIPILYFDDLMPIDEWAGTSAEYAITGDGTAAATLTVTLSFDTKPYLKPAEGENPVELALAEEAKYAKAWYQLAQSDVLVALNATCDSSVQSDTPGAKTALSTYLASVYDFLHAVATGGTPVAPAPKTFTRTVVADNVLDLFELVVGVTIARTANIDPNLDSPIFAAVRSVTTNIRANYTPQPTAQEDDLEEPRTLRQFALDLETALPGMKVAVGTPETGSDGAPRPREIWLLRMSETAGVWYTIDKTTPRFYSIAPVSSALQSGDVWIYPYVSGKYIADSAPAQQSFSNVDLEVLAQEMMAAIEQFLTADYVVPAWKVVTAAGESRPNAVDIILEAKKTLAGKIAATVTPVLAEQLPPPAEGLTDAIESVRQQLLISLNDAYSIDTVLQYPISVRSDFADPDRAPRLYGKPLMVGLTPEEMENFSLTTSRFSMLGGSRYLTFSFGTRSNDSAAVVPLPLRLGITNIEQPLDPVPGIQDYRASSWLTFAIPFAEDVSERDDLGTPDIPVPLRAYPTPPSMTAQNGVPQGAAVTSCDLEKVRAWLYNFTYEYPPADQDAVYATVVFQPLSMSNLAAALDEVTLFDALLQFSVVYRSILEDLNKTLLVPGGDPTVALNAIKSFAWVVDRAAKAWDVTSPQMSLAAQSASGTTTAIKLTESSTIYNGTPGVLLVTMTLLQGTALPAVSIDGYNTVPQGGGFVFTNKATGLPLFRTEAMQMPRRTLTYGDLDVMIEESAVSGTQVLRNESFGGKAANPIFVYRTPEIRFFSPLTPVLESNDPIDIARCTPVRPAPLYDLLKNFLLSLFAGVPAGAMHTLRFGGRFSYPLQRTGPSLSDSEFPVALPIFLTGPIAITSDADLDALAGRVAQFVTVWLSENGLTGKYGTFGFEVSLYAGAVSTQLPTLRLNALYLASTDVT